MEFNSLSSYETYKKENRRCLWLYLKLKIFQLPTRFELFAIFLCPECESMASMDGLQTFQNPEEIKARMCYHSLTASMMFVDWRSIWSVRFSSVDESYEIDLNRELFFVTFIPQSTESSLLAGVRDEENRISILYCTAPRQMVPHCTTCVSRKCFHYLKLVSFYSQQSSGDQEVSEAFEEIYTPEHDVEERDFGFEDHYLKPMPKHVRGYLYGFNFQPIIYPFSESVEQQMTWLERLNGLGKDSTKYYYFHGIFHGGVTPPPLPPPVENNYFLSDNFSFFLVVKSL